jgi:hypothetical protein
MVTYGNLLALGFTVFCLYWGWRLSKIYSASEKEQIVASHDQEVPVPQLSIDAYQSQALLPVNKNESDEFWEAEVVDDPTEILPTRQKPSHYQPVESIRIRSIKAALQGTNFTKHDVEILDALLPGTGYVMPEITREMQHYRKTGEGRWA